MANPILKWPPIKSEIKTIDQNYEPKSTASLINIKDFSFHSGASGLYGGDENILNPEDILATSISSCFFLTFISIANKARLGLSSYESSVEPVLGGEKAKFIEKIIFNLKMKFETPQEHEKIMEIVSKAHKYCVIANTVKSELEFNLEIL